MSRKKRKHPPEPRTLRMDRGARLKSARHWLASQSGRTTVQIAKSYRKRYGVDWPCALDELAILGVRLNRQWVESLRRSLAGAIQRRAQRRAQQQPCGPSGFVEDVNEQFAFIAGHTFGGAPFGVTWDEWREDEQRRPPPRPGSARVSAADEEIPF